MKTILTAGIATLALQGCGGMPTIPQAIRANQMMGCQDANWQIIPKHQRTDRNCPVPPLAERNQQPTGTPGTGQFNSTYVLIPQGGYRINTLGNTTHVISTGRNK
jgi:hypothetical protein